MEGWVTVGGGSDMAGREVALVGLERCLYVYTHQQPAQIARARSGVGAANLGSCEEGQQGGAEVGVANHGGKEGAARKEMRGGNCKEGL